MHWSYCSLAISHWCKANGLLASWFLSHSLPLKARFHLNSSGILDHVMWSIVVIQIHWYPEKLWGKHIDGLVQGRRNSIANVLELTSFCTNPSISNFSSSTVPAAGLVPLGTGKSSGTEMTKFVSHINIISVCQFSIKMLAYHYRNSHYKAVTKKLAGPWTAADKTRLSSKSTLYNHVWNQQNEAKFTFGPVIAQKFLMWPIKMRQKWDPHIFIIGIPILIRWNLFNESVSFYLKGYIDCNPAPNSI